jgi:hypothetical protein
LIGPGFDTGILLDSVTTFTCLQLAKELATALKKWYTHEDLDRNQRIQVVTLVKLLGDIGQIRNIQSSVMKEVAYTPSSQNRTDSDAFFLIKGK